MAGAAARAAATEAEGNGIGWADAAYLEKIAQRVAGCRVTTWHREEGCRFSLGTPHHCDVRLCPDCAHRRAGRMVDRFIPLVLDFRRPVFWTFTMVNVPAGQLASGYDVLQDAWRRLRRSRTWKQVPSGVYSVEVTFPDRTWHPHLHALVDAAWIPWAEVRDAWRAATCDATRAYERREARLAGRAPKCAHATDPETHRPLNGCRGSWMVWVETVKGEPGSDQWKGALRETLKYVSKGLLTKEGHLAQGVTALDVAELVLALRGRRMIVGWGALFGVGDDADELDDGALFGAADFPWERGLPRVCPFCGRPASWSPNTWDGPRLAGQVWGGVLFLPPPARA